MNKKMILGVFALSAAAAFSACKKTASDVTPGDTFNTVKSGNWKVTYFFDSGDETYKFSGYSFNFSDNGTVTATNGSSTVNGTWNTGTDDSATKLDLEFTGSGTFEELNDDWRVTELSATKIVTDDVSGGNNETDYLTFEKI